MTIKFSNKIQKFYAGYNLSVADFNTFSDYAEYNNRVLQLPCHRKKALSYIISKIFIFGAILLCSVMIYNTKIDLMPGFILLFSLCLSLFNFYANEGLFRALTQLSYERNDYESRIIKTIDNFIQENPEQKESILDSIKKAKNDELRIKEIYNSRNDV